ncbi:M48 family metallopeptidase [Wenzhouxiangella sp. XN201]|uniref:M48 family metalloprotease n=1 Tax=Wenzhouxiangella sp. XN201 TaxID=2710755 RepID=UPI0013C62483|nr:M48 family metalloprotease [Wenzhouxiangella sp. XN201]NEZ03365.1 M48 family metallopeptidase [Wenzhouxiangella sp. XN201]
MIQTCRKFLLCCTIVAVSAVAGAQESVRLPDLGGTSTRILSPEEERRFPREFEQYMRASELLVEDPMVRDYFVDMGYRLVSYSDRAEENFHFFVLQEPNINAFAAPAGVIALHSGLLLAAQDEHEVAGVVAHEIAHVTQDHLARGMENAQRTALPTLLASIGLALAAASAGSGGDASQAILLGGMSLAQQFQINYTRQSESEADRIGIQLLARAGYDPHGMTRFFERLNLLSRPMGEGPPEYLRTHPLTVNRIAEARTRAERLDSKPERGDDEFHFVQARLRALSTETTKAELWFRVRLSGSERPTDAMRYGLALTLMRDQRLDAARDEVETLLESSPNRQIFRLLHAELLVNEGRVAEALDELESLMRQYPGSRQVTIEYARTLMHERDTERAAKATQVLRDYLQHHPDDLPRTELYARAADRAGDHVRAAEALAESYYMRGGIWEAIVQLERVIEREDLDYYQRSRIGSRLNQLRAEWLRLSERERLRQRDRDR